MRRRPERPVQPEVTPTPEEQRRDQPSSPDRTRAADADEWIADQLVRLVGRSAREALDVDDPAHAAYLEWSAAEARAQLEPAERLVLAEEARAFAARMRAELAAGRGEPGVPVEAVPATASREKTRRRRRVGTAMRHVDAGPREVPPPRVGAATTLREAVTATARTDVAPWIELAVCAGTGRMLWDEPCERWLAIPADVPPGEHVALPVRGDSMQPLLHDGDTLLVRVGSACVPGDVVVARQPDDGCVVKRVGGPSQAGLRLVADNAQYPDVVLPADPALVLGVVVLRWCPHGAGETARDRGAPGST